MGNAARHGERYGEQSVHAEILLTLDGTDAVIATGIRTGSLPRRRATFSSNP